MKARSLAARHCVDELRRIAWRMPRPGTEDWEDRPSFAPASATDQARLSRVLGRPLPDSFVQFMHLTGGVVGMSVHNGYHLFGAGDVLDAVRASVDEGQGPTDLRPAPAGVATLAIAADGGGNAFVLRLPSGVVDRWNHETNAFDRAAESHVEFLRRVVDDWDAYVGDRPWTFLT